MLDPPLSSRCSTRRCRPASFVPVLALVLMVFPFSVRAGGSPQQTGAVPLTQGIADLASQLAKSIPEGHPMTIAVTDFPQKKQVCGLGQFVAERLSTLLSRQPQCRLIERHRLDQVLQELKFSMSELVDPAKARRLGQMLGVQGLVVGTVTDLGATSDVDARVIDIQTNSSLPGASVSIIKDDAVKQLSSDCGQAASLPASGAQAANVLPPAPAGTVSRVPQGVRKVVVEDLGFEVKSCEMSGSSVRCRMEITNGSREDRDVTIDPDGSRIIDDSGNEYRCQGGRFGSKELSGQPAAGGITGRFGLGGVGVRRRGGPGNTLVPGVPTNCVLTFGRASPEATRATLLEIEGYVIEPGGRRSNFVAQLRDIPLAKR